MSALLVLALVCLVGWIAFRLVESSGGDGEQDRYEVVERRSMPPAIAEGELVLSEQYLRTDRPRRLGARFDQVYRVGTELVPVETKTRFRKKWRRYDQIELSVQAAVLRHARPGSMRDLTVSRYGWVRIAPPGRKPTYLPVPLLDDAELVALHDAYWRVRRGEVSAASAPASVTCERCAYLPKCPRPNAHAGMRGSVGAGRGS